jgi:hypothetical protein
LSALRVRDHRDDLIADGHRLQFFVVEGDGDRAVLLNEEPSLRAGLRVLSWTGFDLLICGGSDQGACKQQGRDGG